MGSGISGQPPNGGVSGDRFGVERRTDSGTLILVLAGELDHDTAEPLRAALGDAVRERPERILVDCAELRFCDSTGLNVLLRARLEAQESGGRLDLASLRPPVARMFDITGASTVFRVYGTVDAALADEPPS
ncbi:STAS domain-containing protein [Streptomyces sp. NPDC014894]|uniref:STAS domain-containing protein n=1 Tax=unclassified Streptomyces TaxID=2593676 RepID=UPI0036FA17A2